MSPIIIALLKALETQTIALISAVSVEDIVKVLGGNSNIHDGKAALKWREAVEKELMGINVKLVAFAKAIKFMTEASALKTKYLSAEGPEAQKAVEEEILSLLQRVEGDQTVSNDEQSV